VKPQRIAVIGGGWAGLAAAVHATRHGHHVTLFEASRQWGGRARAVAATLPDGSSLVLDNGQHILIGAYTETLALMRLVGVDPTKVFLRLPLCMQFPDGQGLRLPDWPMPLDVAAGVLGAVGWTLADKWSLLRSTARWQLSGFRCDAGLSVLQLCAGMSTRVMQTLIEPLCVSALNTPADRASGQVFLRVLKDSLLGGKGSSNLLLPLVDLSALFPGAATRWLQSKGATLRLGHRVQRLEHAIQWQVDGEAFDAVICATSSSALCQLLADAVANAAVQQDLQSWTAHARPLQFEAITTVYAQGQGIRLAQPMLALHSDAHAPAQFVFDRGQLGGPAGLLAFVVSASDGERSSLQNDVLSQAHTQLAPWLHGQRLQPIQTIVEKRATFACTPALVRPAQAIAPGLLACGDYVHGPYPATLEGAVRSGMGAVHALSTIAGSA
jgi:squalene-associated FAD-dependent desaturase